MVVMNEARGGSERRQQRAEAASNDSVMHGVMDEKMTRRREIMRWQDGEMARWRDDREEAQEAGCETGCAGNELELQTARVAVRRPGVDLTACAGPSAEDSQRRADGWERRVTSDISP